MSAVRLYSEFTNLKGETWRVNFHDEDFTGTATQVKLGGEGFVLTYQGGEDIFQPILASTCSVEFVQQDATQQGFINDLTGSAEEGRFLLSVRRDPDGDDELYWHGVLLQDQIVIPDIAAPRGVELTATDDLGCLQDILYRQSSDYPPGEAFTGNETLKDHLLNCLNLTRSSVLVGASDTFVKIARDFIPEDLPDVATCAWANTRTNHESFYNRDQDGVIQFLSVYEVLQQLLTVFNARCFMHEGAWHVIPIGAYINSATLQNVHPYRKGGVSAGSAASLATSKTLDIAAQRKVSGWEYSFRPPVQRYLRDYNYLGNLALANINVAESDFGSTTYNEASPFTFQIGETMSFSGTLRINQDQDTTLNGTDRLVRYLLSIKFRVGNRVLKRQGQVGVNNAGVLMVGTTDQNNPNQIVNIFQGYHDSPTWSSTLTDTWDLWTPPVKANSDYIEDDDQHVLQIPFTFTTPALVLEGTGVTLDFSLVGYSGTTSSDGSQAPTTTNSSSYLGDADYQIDDFQVVFGDLDAANGDAITYAWGHSTGARDIVEVPASILGDKVTSNSTGAIEVQTGASTFAFTDNWYSYANDSSATQKHPINKLLVRQRILMRRDPGVVQRGQIYGSGLISPLNAFQDNTDEYQGRYIVTSLAYHAHSAVHEVELFQVEEYSDADLTEIDNVDSGKKDIFEPFTQDPGVVGGIVQDNFTEGMEIATDTAGSVSGGSLSAADQNKLAAITVDGTNGITDFSVKSGSTVLDADEIDDASSTNKFATAGQLNEIAANTSAISDIQAVFKESTAGDGAGVYIDPASTTESHVSVTSTSGKFQAGENTKLELSETSPGSMSLKVQAGPSGSEAAVTAVTISGSSSVNTKATTNFTGGDCRFTNTPVQFNSGSAVTFQGTSTFNGTTSGIDYGDLDNTPTIPGSPLADANQTLAGDRRIICATNDLEIENPGVFQIENSSGSAIFKVTPGSPSTIEMVGTVKFDSGLQSGGSIRLEEFNGSGNSAVVLRAPGSMSADVTYTLPATDGSSGQVLQTDGSGALSFADSGGSSESYITLQSSFYTGDGNGDYIPLGGTLTETTSFQYYNAWVAPLAGEVVKANIFCTGTGAGASSLHMRKYPSTTNVATASATFTTSNQVKEFSFSSATFSAGDRLHFRFDPTGTPAGVSVTLLIKLTHP